MKKLLVITNTMNQGGAETFLMKIYRKLDKSKYQFDFYIMGGEGYYDKEIINLGGNVTYGSMKTKNFRNYKKQFCSFLKNSNYKYVYKSIATSISALDLYYVKKGKKTNSIIARSMITNTSRPLIHTLFRPIANTFSNVKIAPSTEAATFMFGKRRTKRGDVFLLNNGVDTSLFKFNRGLREQKRTELGIGEMDKLYIHIGRFDKQKNHIFLLEVFNKIYENNDKAYLLLIGKGYLKPSVEHYVLENNLSKNVIFLEEREDIPELLMAADLLLLPSHFEGLPNVVIEAQATGLPSLVSNKVTAEVKVTEFVHFLPITNVTDWVIMAKQEEIFLKPDERNEFKQFPAEYDTVNTVNKFIELVFKEI